MRMYWYTSSAYGSLPGAPAMSPRITFGVGTVFDAGRYATSGELKNGSVVYSLIFFVYSSSIGILGSRTKGCEYDVGAAGVFACCAASGDCRNAPATARASATSFFMEASQNNAYA